MARSRRPPRVSDSDMGADESSTQSDDDDDDDDQDDQDESQACTGYCTRCSAAVGVFFNAWHKITKTYYLPALVASYSTRLVRKGEPKASKAESELSGCHIQSLFCPSPQCAHILGFQVFDAPPEKQPYRGRHFFKLRYIQLRCGKGPTNHTIQEPVVVPQPNTPPPPPPPPPPLPRTSTPTMEVDSRPPPPFSGPSHGHSHYSPHHDPHHRPFEPAKPSLPPLTARSPPAPLPLHTQSRKSPTNPPLPSPSSVHQPVHDAHHVQQPPPPPPKQSPNLVSPTRTREILPIAPQHSHAPAEPRPNAQNYPRPPPEVQMDAIERLQTQISQNSSTLVAHGREMRLYEEKAETSRHDLQVQFHHQTVEIRRVDEAVGRLQHEMQGVRDLLENLTREFQARGASTAPGHSISGQDSALELMAQQMAVMAHKANEVDTLKITIEIMKNKIQRLEDAAPGINAPQQPPSQYASPQIAPARIPVPHAAPYHALPSQVPQVDIPAPVVQRTQSYHSHGSQSVAATPEASQRAEPPHSQGGWATVNAGTKRTHPNGIDSPQDSGLSIGSPKRPKLAPIEPRGAYASSQSQHPHVYDHMDTDDSDAARMHTHSHTLPSQTISTGSAAQSTLPTQRSQFIPYGTQDAPSDDSWRPESQRILDVRTPRSRGRGGGPGSRGGRVRKSMGAQHSLGTPEWERDDWHGIPESQINPDGFYTVARSRGIVRRGSGGGGASRGGRPGSSGRAVSLGMQGVTASVGIGMPVDPYAHTKKTRTKPVRNADGVLIRKDGRPDMRSQSSAANLRKVHARKEDSKDGEHPYTPTPTHLHQSMAASETASPSPTGYGPQDLTASQQKKHNHVMSKMFPGGVNEVTKDHELARKVFEEDQDHTAHPRPQQHHHHQAPHSHSHEIKHERTEERISNTLHMDGADVDMDRPEDHADDEGQTPGAQSDNSGRESQYHSVAEAETQNQPPQQEQEK